MRLRDRLSVFPANGQFKQRQIIRAIRLIDFRRGCRAIGKTTRKRTACSDLTQFRHHILTVQSCAKDTYVGLTVQGNSV